MEREQFEVDETWILCLFLKNLKSFRVFSGMNSISSSLQLMSEEEVGKFFGISPEIVFGMKHWFSCNFELIEVKAECVCELGVVVLVKSLETVPVFSLRMREI